MKIRLLVLAFVGGLMIQTGDTAFNMLKSARIDKGSEGSSQIVLTFAHPVTYTISPHMNETKVRMVVPQSGIEEGIFSLGLADPKVKRVGFIQEPGGNAIIEIYLADLKTSLFHSRSRDGRTLTIDLRSRTSLLAVNTDLEKERMLAEKSEADKKLLAELKVIRSKSGRDAYREAMLKFQANEFDSALNLFDNFVDDYPESVYREKAIFMKAESLYRIAKDNKSRINEAVDAFRVAKFTYPLSEYAVRSEMRVAELFRVANYDVEALALYDNMVKLNPEGKYVLTALKGRANIFLARGDYGRAYNELERILLQYPSAKEIREARFKIADAFYYQKKYERALAIYEDSHAKWPTFVRTNSVTLRNFADTYFQLERYQEAKGFYLDLINLFPEAVEGKEAVNRMAEIYLDENDMTAAVKILGLQARLRPNDPQGLESRLRLAALGHSDKKVIEKNDTVVVAYNDYFEPEKTYDNIVKEHPGTDQARDALYQKARLLLQEKRYIESLTTLRMLMRDYENARFSRPVVATVEENLRKMIHEFHGQQGYYRVLATWYENFDPFLSNLDDAGVLTEVADAYYETGLYTRALEKYGKASRLDRKGLYNERTSYGKGKAHAALKEYQLAEESLRPFTGQLRFSELAQDALHTLGDVYYEEARNDRALETYHRAVSMNKDHPRVSLTEYRMAGIEKEKENYRQAVKYFSDSLAAWKPTEGQEEPRHIMEAYYQLVEAAFLGGQYASAAEYAETAMAKYPDGNQNSWAAYVKSDSLARLSKDEHAVAQLKEIATDQPDTVYGKVASASVDNLDWKMKHKELFAY